ncbi:hypothetical protein [Streptomyces sp. BF23-19]|uniref:hypothetical protein n=1 Tax=Streptomyces TaxID=1883 RepID=UPI0034E43A69|nr:hypothetical protein OG253_40625 [Streptomyces virginiae]
MYACGWRGPAQYGLARDMIGDRPLYEADVDLAGPLADRTAHSSVVREAAAVPLPELLAVLLAEVPSRLSLSPTCCMRAAGSGHRREPTRRPASR